MSKSDADVPEGYKMTELGPLPEEWQTVPVGQVCTLRREMADPKSEAASPYVGLEHIDSGDPVLRRHGHASEVRSGKSRFEAGDILYGKLRPYLDKAVLVHEGGICSTDILVLSADGHKVTGGFLVGLLHTRRFCSYAKSTMTGVNHPRTSWPSISKYSIPLPPLSEQNGIAAVLAAVQEAREKTEGVIQAAKALKKSLMKYLFTYGPVPVDEAEKVSLKETEIGQIPEGWEVGRLGEMGRLQYGYTATAQERAVGPRFLRITDIDEEGRVSWGTVPYCLIDESEMAKFMLRDGDIVVARIGATTGKASIVKDPPRAVFASYLIRFTVEGDVSTDPDFVGCFTRTPMYWRQIQANRGGKLKQGVSASVLKELLVPLPPVADQKRIAEIARALEENIAAQEDRKLALEELFKTLLNDLMTAKIRVNDLEVAA